MKLFVGAFWVSLVVTAAASAQTPAGGEFRVNTYTTGFQNVAAVAAAANGGFVVVWNSFGQDGSGNGIFGQRYDRSGLPIGSEFQVNTTINANQYVPAVAFGGKGFIVAWQSPDGDSLGIFAQRFDATGTRIGAEFRVNTEAAARQILPAVSADALGRFVVAWVSDGQDGSQAGVFAQRFDSSGTPAGSEFRVNTVTTGYQAEPRVAHDRGGNFLVVWDSPGDGSAQGVFGQRFDAAGQRIGAEFQVNTTTTGYQDHPAPAMAPDGRFVVSWTSQQDGSGLSVLARLYDALGTPLGGEFLVNTFTLGNQDSPSPTMDETGDFAIAWTSRSAQDGSAAGVFARRFDASGNARGGEFQVNSYTTGTQDLSFFAPSLASDSAGNLVATWRGETQDGSGDGVFAQRFGGLHPNALVADASPGNLVWEPGETVGLRPNWLNVNGAAQTFGGTLTNITGPAGGVYGITDGTGDYGTVANNANATCTDCYSVTVDNPTVRPQQHWDASALETITPDAQGQVKRWSLHLGKSFTDVPNTNPFYRFVETLFHKGVTGGCGGTNYCPSTPTTRDQMSVFVLVAKEGAGYTPVACGTPVFNDVPASSPFCRYIEELFRRGVVSGCGGGAYCPTSAVTRDQMAIFVLRTLDPALNPPACGAPMFTDVPASSPFCRWIEELARRGVVTGCGNGNYCPSASVTREQMGVFISATFGLTLYGP